MKVRKVCEYDENWHYIYDEQETINENLTCLEHLESTMRDFVIINNNEE